MNLELRLKEILIACKIADWYSTDITVDYDLDLSLGILFADGKIVFYNDSILEFTESITPDRFKYRYHYMDTGGHLIFRYDNVPHHREIASFPDHKHYPNTVIESEPVDLRQVIEEIINIIVDENHEG
jgi:uncharacterized protein (DUF2344 family)